MDEITNKLLVGADYETTKTAILGPFFRTDTPPTANDANIVKTMPPDGEKVYMHGIVRDAATRAPIEGVTVDIWQCSTNGLYEQQDPDQAEFNLRGKFTTDKNGYYGLYCLRPVPYPVPNDGKPFVFYFIFYFVFFSSSCFCPSFFMHNMNRSLIFKFQSGPAGELLELLDRHPFRPAHIHIIVSVTPGSKTTSRSVSILTLEKAGNNDYTALTTQIFDRKSKYLVDDSVFAVKDDLVVDFKPVQGNPKFALELEYDINLVARKD